MLRTNMNECVGNAETRYVKKKFIRVHCAQSVAIDRILYKYGVARHKYKTTSDKEGIDDRSSKVVAAIGSRNEEQKGYSYRLQYSYNQRQRSFNEVDLSDPSRC